MGDGELDVRPLAGVDHFVGFGERAAEGLFHVDVDPALGRRDDHVAVRVDPSRHDGHDLRLHLVEHPPVVGEQRSLAKRKPLRGRREAHFVVVGDGDDFAVGNFAPHGVQPVPVIAASGPSNYRDSITLWHTVLACLAANGPCAILTQPTSAGSKGFIRISRPLHHGLAAGGFTCNRSQS